MKVSGNFNYYLDGVQLNSFDEFERKIKNINVTIDVTKTEIHARTIEK